MSVGSKPRLDYQSVLFAGQKVDLSNASRGSDALLFHDDGIYTLLERPPEALDDKTVALIVESHVTCRNIIVHNDWLGRMRLISMNDWVEVVKYAQYKRFI